jgi:hypothetical protein
MSMHASSAPSTSWSAHSPSRRDPHRRRLSSLASRGHAIVRTDRLAAYRDADGRLRELLALPGNGGSVLVLDRDAVTLCDRRLLAHLAADEPPENAELVCRHYLSDAGGRWCRRVLSEDLRAIPFATTLQSEHATVVGSAADADADEEIDVKDRCGNVYRLGPFPGGRSSQLCWSRLRNEAGAGGRERVKLRDVVAALESYEPVRTLTEQAIARHGDDRLILSTRLCDEFERLCTSPIVLNRALREAVLATIERDGTSMSEIALRCGIVKRDRHGNPSGETSWLARRVGLMPEGGAQATTPWIHSDVLAMIARKGLALSPREVELQ